MFYVLSNIFFFCISLRAFWLWRALSVYLCVVALVCCGVTLGQVGRMCETCNRERRRCGSLCGNVRSGRKNVRDKAT